MTEQQIAALVERLNRHDENQARAKRYIAQAEQRGAITEIPTLDRSLCIITSNRMELIQVARVLGVDLVAEQAQRARAPAPKPA